MYERTNFSSGAHGRKNAVRNKVYPTPRSTNLVIISYELSPWGSPSTMFIRSSLQQVSLPSRKNSPKAFRFVVLRNRAKCQTARFSSSKMSTTADVFWKSTVESGFESFVKYVPKRTALCCDRADLGFKLAGHQISAWCSRSNGFCRLSFPVGFWNIMDLLQVFRTSVEF